MSSAKPIKSRDLPNIRMDSIWSAAQQAVKRLIFEQNSLEAVNDRPAIKIFASWGMADFRGS